MEIVDEGQSLFDIAIQKAGDITSAFEYAVLNGISITDILMTGSQLNAATVAQPPLVKYLSNENVVPASGTIKIEDTSADGGVDFWAIGLDFTII